MAGQRQDMATGIIWLANTLYKQGNTLAVKRIPGTGVAGNGAAGTYAKDPAGHGVAGKDSRLVVERLAPLPQEAHSQAGNTTGHGETKHGQEGLQAPRT